MSSVADRVVTGVLVVCAVAVTAVTIRREVSPSAEAPPQYGRERTVPQWERHVDAERLEGIMSAPVTLVEYSDFQCPFCKDLADVIGRAKQRYGDQLAVVHKHYPLEAIHRFAFPAAVASECARRQGMFRAYHDTLFGAQDALGSRSWTEVAGIVGVEDTTRFVQCMSDSSVSRTVRQDAAEAKVLNVRGTPALLINDKLVEGTLTDEELETYIQAALRNRDRR
jgi:protein-disulfide isomerase